MKKLFTLLAVSMSLTVSVWANTDAEGKQAICDGNLTAVKKIYTTKAKIDKIGDVGYKFSPLELASYCYGGQPEIVSYFLDKGANVNSNVSGYTPLMWVLRSVNLPLNTSAMRTQALRMIKMGVNVNYQDPTTGRTALMGAASLGDNEMIELLLAKNAKKDFKTKGDWCISGNPVSCTAADHARLAGFVEVALQLEGKNAKEYQNSLNYNIRLGNTDNLVALIRKSNVNAVEELSNLTALHYAVEKSDIQTIKVLLKAGANPNIANYAGITPLRNAVVRYKTDIAKALIDGGAKASNEQTQGCGGGLSEFGWAIEYDLPEIAKYMIAKGAIDVKNPGTAFISLYGRYENNIEIAKLLIAKGAKPTKADIQKLEEIKEVNSFLKYTTGVIQVLQAAIDNKLKDESSPNRVSRIEGSRFQMTSTAKIKTRGGGDKKEKFESMYMNKKKNTLDDRSMRDPIN